MAWNEKMVDGWHPERRTDDESLRRLGWSIGYGFDCASFEQQVAEEMYGEHPAFLAGKSEGETDRGLEMRSYLT